MAQSPNLFFLLVVGLASWFIPGAGYFLLNEKKRAAIIFVTITLTFGVGLYIGSIGIVDPIGAKFAYAAQIMNSPAVALIGRIASGGGYAVYGRPNEIGQLYTVISGMLNLLCIINVIYMAHLRHETPGRRLQ
jgi:hypothetical protein